MGFGEGMMWLAGVLFCLVLITTSMMGGLFARYITSATGSDSARVASFGDLTLTETGDFDGTENKKGMIIPVIITVYADRSFTFITKTPPAPVLLKKAAKVEKGSGEPNKNKVGSVTMAQIEEIAKLKMPDLNCKDLEGAVRNIMGTARSMGLEVK